MDEIRMDAEGGVPVFRPTWEQFKSFKEFIEKIEPIGMQTGIVKVIPPQEWLDRVPKIDNELIRSQVKIKNPIEQEATGTQGVFSFNNILKRRNYTLEQWRKYCDSHRPPKPRNSANLETKSTREQPLWEHYDTEFDAERCAHLESSYWKTLGFNAPVYAADVQGSLFRDLDEWNVANLDSLLNKLHVKIPGVNTSYIYCGSWKASFAWHLEDMDLHSINYIHFGAPKQWYSIPQADRHRFYQVMKSYWPRDQRKCHEFLRHKNYMVSPAVLEKEGVQVNKIIHRQNEFMITFPYGYHAGFNLGYNLAESVNFATDTWVPIGRDSTPCKCADDNACFDVRVLLGEMPVYMTPPEDEPQIPIHTQPARAQPDRKIKRTGECLLCPHKWDGQYLPVVGSNGEQLVHGICADFIPETWAENGQVHGIDGVSVDRYGLRCLECKLGTGACFQCEHETCTRSFHATCAMSSGMVTHDNKYLCRQHRPRTSFLEPQDDPDTLAFAALLVPGQPVQCRTPQGRVFAGTVVENDKSEGTLVVESFPNFDAQIEVAYQWVYPGTFSYIPRPPIVPKVKAKTPKPKPKPKPKDPEPEPKLEPQYVPPPPPPQKMHLYGVEGDSGDLESPFVFLGIPLPACLQRTTPL